MSLFTATEHRVLTTWEGYCASCPTEQPLLLVSRGPQGFRGWLSGAGHEDRTLSYACAVCGRAEHVPLTEDDDLVYDASLLRWPDWIEDTITLSPAAQAAAQVSAPVHAPLISGDVFGLAALQLVHAAPAVTLEAPAVVLEAPALVFEAAVSFEAPAQPVLAPAPRKPVVRVGVAPAQRVSATDLLLAVA